MFSVPQSLKFRGQVVSQGVARGRLLVVRAVDVLGLVEERRVGDVEGELERLSRAGSLVRERLEELKRVLPAAEREIVDAQLLMLESLVAEAGELVKSSSLSAEYAVKSVYEKYAEMLKSGSELFALRVQDLRDLASRLVSVLTGGKTAGGGYSGRIAVAEELDPIQFLEAAEEGLAGLVTRKGGLTAHVSILARLKGVPYMISGELDLGLVRDGDEAVLDCVNGVLLVNPTAEEEERYGALAEEYNRMLALFSKEEGLEPVTLDGRRVDVLCNAGGLEEVRAAPGYGCGGIGLFRIEFAYMVRQEAPGEEELYGLFKKSLEVLGGRPLTVRAPDIGGDKPVNFLELPKEANPQLGLRGTRLLLEYRDKLLRPLLRAALRAAVHGDLRLMFPMVSTVEEVEELSEEVRRAEEELRSEGFEARVPRLGVMVEVPSAALLSRELVEKGGLSFVSFGTNDLTQYVLAADRGSAHVGKVYDELNPAVLRLIAYAVDKLGGRAEVEVCGEMASRTLAVPALLGLGVQGLSVAPVFVGRVKYVVRRIDLEEASREVREVVESASTSREVRAWARSYLERRGIRVFE